MTKRARKQPSAASNSQPEDAACGPVIPASSGIATGGFRLCLHIKPGARQNRITGLTGDGRLGVQIAAPPRDGEANDAVMVYIAQMLGIRKSDVTLVSGQRSRDKNIQVAANSRLTARTAADVCALLLAQSDSS